MADVFTRTTRLEAPAEEAFAWHERPGALPRLTPPWERVRIVEAPAGLVDGSRAVLRVKVGPFRRTWVAEHRGYRAGRQFEDVQVSGPFARWEHLHAFAPEGPTACTLTDRITWALPLGGLGRLLGGRAVRRKLERVFAYRHRTTADDLASHRGAASPPLRVGVTGASGLMGSALLPFLTTGGHEVVRLPRRVTGPAEVEGLDAVVHLAGENIATRWTKKKRARIVESRVEGTRALVEALGRLGRPPRVLVSASAIGAYGDRGDEVLRESSAEGEGFLADVARAWEGEARKAESLGMRVVLARFGVILSPAGGALGKMLGPVRAGVGGRLGTGRQWWSWIGIDDAVAAVHHALVREDVRGPVNVVAPEPATNREFTKTLGRVVSRPTLVPLPRLAGRLAFGTMADAVLFASQRVEPAALLASGYRFRFPRLEEALRHLLGRTA